MIRVVLFTLAIRSTFEQKYSGWRRWGQYRPHFLFQMEFEQVDKLKAEEESVCLQPFLPCPPHYFLLHSQQQEEKLPSFPGQKKVAGRSSPADLLAENRVRLYHFSLTLSVSVIVYLSVCLCLDFSLFVSLSLFF